MSDPKALLLAQVFWLLDYDGSLCPHREEWERGHYDPQELSQILDALASKSAGLMWNTGRSVDSLKTQSLSFLNHSGFFEHGACFWNGTTAQSLVDMPLPSAIAIDTLEWAKSREDWLRVEFKKHSVRLIPVQARDRSRLLAEFRGSDLCRDLLAAGQVYLSEGWRALEVVKVGVNKSNALEQLTKSNANFAGLIPAVVGDDIGDADIVARVLGLGGVAYLVGSHCGWISGVPHRASQVATFASPKDLLNHLLDVVRVGALDGKMLNKKIPHTPLKGA